MQGGHGTEKQNKRNIEDQNNRDDEEQSTNLEENKLMYSNIKIVC